MNSFSAGNLTITIFVMDCVIHEDQAWDWIHNVISLATSPVFLAAKLELKINIVINKPEHNLEKKSGKNDDTAHPL